MIEQVEKELQTLGNPKQFILCGIEAHACIAVRHDSSAPQKRTYRWLKAPCLIRKLFHCINNYVIYFSTLISNRASTVLVWWVWCKCFIHLTSAPCVFLSVQHMTCLKREWRFILWLMPSHLEGSCALSSPAISWHTMHIYWFIFLILGSTGIFLHYLLFKKLFILPILFPMQTLSSASVSNRSF